MGEDRGDQPQPKAYKDGVEATMGAAKALAAKALAAKALAAKALAAGATEGRGI